MEHTPVASQSSDSVYHIAVRLFAQDGKSRLSVNCDCPAADYHEIVCKHEQDLLTGKGKFLADESYRESVNRIAELVNATDFWQEYRRFESYMDDLKKKEKEIKKQMAALKRQAKNEIGGYLASGVEVES